MPVPTGPELTTSQAAGRMGLTSSAVRELCNAGKLPGAIKRHSRWYIPQTTIENWLQNQLEPSELEAPTRWQRFRSQPWIFWPTLFITGLSSIALFFFVAVSAGADFGPFQEQLYQWEIVRRFDARQEDEVLIVIFAFETGNERQSGIQEDLWAAIGAHIEQLDLSNIRVERDPRVIPANDRELARSLGQRHDATVIIWGSDTDFRVQIEFLNLVIDEDAPATKTILEEEHTRLASPPDYHSFVSQEVRPLVSFLSLFAIGQAYCCAEDYTTAIKVLDYSLEKIPDNLSSTVQSEIGLVWFLLASSYQALDNQSEAMVAYTRAIAVRPDFAIAYNNRGALYRELGQDEQAIVDYSEAIRVAPRFAIAYNNRGATYSNLAKYELALADLDKATQIDPDLPDPYSNRAFRYIRLGQYQQAIVEANKAIQLNPNFPDAYNERGFAYDELGQYEKGIADYSEVIRLNPSKASVYVNRAYSYNEIGQFEKALADANVAISLEPNWAVPYSIRGAAYTGLKKYRQALDDFNQAIRLDPYYPGSYSNRSAVYYKLGQYELALDNANEAIRLDPNGASVYNDRGHIHLRLEQYEQALVDFQRFLEIQPNSTDRAGVEAIIRAIEAILNQ